eukprot:1758844-Rhodomonas_salina.1
MIPLLHMHGYDSAPRMVVRLFLFTASMPTSSQHLTRTAHPNQSVWEHSHGPSIPLVLTWRDFVPRAAILQPNLIARVVPGALAQGLVRSLPQLRLHRRFLPARQ